MYTAAQLLDRNVVELSEKFDSVSGNPMTLNCTISAQQLTLGSETLENEWPV